MASLPEFAVDAWRSSLPALNDVDANELRGAVARLLSSDPDHTGLLLVRSLTEMTRAEPNFDEVVSNLQAAFTSGPRRFGLKGEALSNIADWTFRSMPHTSWRRLRRLKMRSELRRSSCSRLTLPALPRL